MKKEGIPSFYLSIECLDSCAKICVLSGRISLFVAQLIRRTLRLADFSSFDQLLNKRPDDQFHRKAHFASWHDQGVVARHE